MFHWQKQNKKKSQKGVELPSETVGTLYLKPVFVPARPAEMCCEKAQNQIVLLEAYSTQRMSQGRFVLQTKQCI